MKTHTGWKLFLKRGLLTLLLIAFALPLTGLMYQFAAARMDERNFLPPGQLIDVGGYRLHIHCTGNGSPTVILESGLGGTSLDWSLVQSRRGEMTRVCAYDRAGLGWSEVNPANPSRTSQQITKELHTLLENTGIPGPYILVGLSAGGMHVQMYADQYPDEVAGIVLVDPTPANLIAGFTQEERGPLLPNLDQFSLLQKLEPFGLLRILPLPGSEVLTKLPSPTQNAIRALNTKTGITRALYQEAAGFEASIMQTASLEPLSPQVPLTIIWHGIPVEPLELEPLAEQSLRALAGQSESGRFVVAENSGHYIPFDRPDVIIKELIVMIDTLRSASAGSDNYVRSIASEQIFRGELSCLQ
jgi:pimeloyl-ACP methyl ester carboxylesterase